VAAPIAPVKPPIAVLAPKIDYPNPRKLPEDKALVNPDNEPFTDDIDEESVLRDFLAPSAAFLFFPKLSVI
jgi:hypothetical protein